MCKFGYIVDTASKKCVSKKYSFRVAAPAPKPKIAAKVAAPVAVRQKTQFKPAVCTLQFAGFVDGILDSIVYIWSASKRCAAGYDPVNPELDDIACVEDVSSSIKSGLNTLDNVMSMLKPCGWVAKDISIFGKCVSSIGGLVANTAGLVDSAAKVADWCTLDTPPTPGAIAKKTALGACLSNIGDSTKDLLALSVTLSAIAKHKCTGKMCKAAILLLMHVAAKFGEAFAYAFNNCDLSPVGGAGLGNQQAGCAGAIFGLADALTGLSAHGYLVSTACKCDVKKPVRTIRRYIEGRESPESSTNSNAMTFAIAAAIPIASVVSFISGLRYAKSGGRNTKVQAGDGEEFLE